MLTNKYRPKTFDEIIGQSGIDIIKSYVGKQDIPGLWIFYGPKGTGKTSSARVFALALNCENLKLDKNPCLSCLNCRDILNDFSVDRGGFSRLLVEIDGASNRGIDEVRSLREMVKLKSRGKRVVVIDEAQMLTEPAWNALLKITEEPPSSVIFILVTTALGKILETIRDRALLVEFRAVSDALLVRHLRHLARLEGVEDMLSSEVIDLIIKYSGGSVRSIVKGLDMFVSLLKEGKGDYFADYYVKDEAYDIENLVKSMLEYKLDEFGRAVGELKNKGYSPVEILINLYSSLLSVKLRSMGYRMLKDGIKYSGYELDDDIFRMILDRFPFWLSIIKEVPSYDLLLKFMIENIILSGKGVKFKES